MAVDEALLESAQEIGTPVLRLYAWLEPAATFGFSQKYTDVEQMTCLRPLIRRPTGGGLVPHDRDWTYSLVFPPTHAWYKLRAIESYRKIHVWLQATFQKVGLRADLAPETRRATVGQCFIGAEQFDVVLEGQKIAGAAQRRNKFGLLIQGSIQPPADLKRPDWEAALLSEQAFLPFAPPTAWEVRVRELVSEKYSSAEYNQRR
jgi:lipoyl(octanoyl) transferase